MSKWHGSQGWENRMDGQIRYAVRGDGGDWGLATLFRQRGQLEAPNPLEALADPAVAPSADGSAATAVGVAWHWETDSIYNDGDLPVTFRALAVDATVSGL